MEFCWTWYGAKRPWLSLWESWLPLWGSLRGSHVTITQFQTSNGAPSQSACSADSSPIGRAKGAVSASANCRFSHSQPTGEEYDSPHSGWAKYPIKNCRFDFETADFLYIRQIAGYAMVVTGDDRYSECSWRCRLGSGSVTDAGRPVFRCGTGGASWQRDCGSAALPP